MRYRAEDYIDLLQSLSELVWIFISGARIMKPLNGPGRSRTGVSSVPV